MPPRHLTRSFLLIAAITFLGYGLFSVFAALAPSLATQLLPWKGPAISGASVALLFAGSTGAQLVFRNLRPRHGMALGCAIIMVSLMLLVLSLDTQSAPLFILSDVIGGFGQGLGFMATLAALNRMSPAEARTGLIASFFVASYLGGVLPVLGLGLLADRIGMYPAIACLSIALGSIAISLAVLAHRTKGPISTL